MDANAYVECMTMPRTVTVMRFLQILSIMLLIGFLLIALLFSNLIAFIIVIAAGVGIWFFGLRSSVEYEYTYVEKELTVDRIFNKTSRKHVADYKISEMELFAPIGSHRLDGLAGRQLETLDYSGGPGEPDPRYVMIIEGGKRLILEPSENLVRAIRTVAPGKVFTD